LGDAVGDSTVELVDIQHLPIDERRTRDTQRRLSVLTGADAGISAGFCSWDEPKPVA
jgi:hypothetical protein